MSDHRQPSATAIVVAAGRGVRAGGDTPKQWQKLGKMTVAQRTLNALGSHPNIDKLVLVLNPDDMNTDLWPTDPPAKVVPGGATRAASVRAGLAAVEGGTTHVLIHDVARPLVSHALIDRVLAALTESPAAAPALPVTDALWTGADGRVTGTRDRNGLFRAQTPQGFEAEAILAAHRAFEGDPADDVEVARAAGLPVTIVRGEEENLKITGPGDFARAEQLLKASMSDPPDIRLGNGFDVHRFGSGDHVILCGVRIPHSRGLQGHSDADVGLHTLTDAIYGALAAGDIGGHFPPSDPQWKGADSAVFLDHAAGLARDMGYGIANLDLTLVCELPKIGPHAAAMIERVSEITGVERERISVKATTSERLGFTGRQEGIAAFATASLIRR